MERRIKFLMKLIVRLIVTPILILITLVILIFYTVYGVIIVPIQTLRYIGLLIIASIKSAFDNDDYTDDIMETLFEFLKKFISFYGHIFYIPFAVWVPADENPSNLNEIVEYQQELLSKNWASTILIFASLIFSFTFSFSILGFKCCNYLKNTSIPVYVQNYFNLSPKKKEIIYWQNLTESRLDSLDYIDKIQLQEIRKYYQNMSLNIETK